MANNLMQFDPFTEIARFDPFRRLDDMFKHYRPGGELEAMQPMRMDVSETDQAYKVKADMPGMNKDDIKIDINGNQVTISAETRRETENRQQGEAMLRSERYYGQQYRSFTLPQDIDDGKAEAKYKDGVLELTLPKKTGGGAKKITVS
jgi:HSP20 family protein